MSEAKAVEVGEIIRIVDPELDVDAIMAEIKARLASRAPLDPDPPGLVYRATDAAQSELEWELEQAAEAARDLGIGDQLRPGAGLVAGLATRLKRPLHQLVRFYVDLSVQRQASVQGHVVRALQLLAAENGRLRAEVAELKGMLATGAGTAGAGDGAAVARATGETPRTARIDGGSGTSGGLDAAGDGDGGGVDTAEGGGAGARR